MNDEKESPPLAGRVVQLEFQNMKLRSELDDIKAKLKKCVSAMERSVDVGCTDHLDACDDAGDFWHLAIEEARKALESK